MRNKMIIIIGAIVVLFGALYFINDYKNKQTIENNENPYGDKKLEQSTIAQLDDPLYNNQIMPEELKEEVESGEPVTVYFYSPECIHCQNTTPVLVPVTEDLDIDVVKLNLLEFPAEWDNWGIESTPTLVHYDDSEEVARIIGERTEEEFQAFFNEYVID